MPGSPLLSSSCIPSGPARKPGVIRNRRRRGVRPSEVEAGGGSRKPGTGSIFQKSATEGISQVGDCPADRGRNPANPPRRSSAVPKRRVREDKLIAFRGMGQESAPRSTAVPRPTADGRNIDPSLRKQDELSLMSRTGRQASLAGGTYCFHKLREGDRLGEEARDSEPA